MSAPEAEYTYLRTRIGMDSRNFEYMFYGFLAAWLLIVIYVVTLVVREHRLKRELDQVKAMLEDREKKEL